MAEVIAKDQLTSYITRLERLEQEKSDLSDDIKDIYADAKSSGFDIKALKKVLRLKKMDKNKLAEEEAMVELYRGVLGV
jgi:uncharacterized protein (UPF0335 family)